MVKNSPAKQKTQIRSLGQEDLLEKEMDPHSSIFAWKNPMDRGGWQATVHGVSKSWTQLSYYKQQQQQDYVKAMLFYCNKCKELNLL